MSADPSQQAREILQLQILRLEEENRRLKGELGRWEKWAKQHREERDELKRLLDGASLTTEAQS